MRVIVDVPPMFAEIDAAFHVAGKQVIFAWGDKIYNPLGIAVPAALIAHERVHGARQGTDIKGWWRRYIDEPHFRLDEEIAAHRAELAVLMEKADTRNVRRGLVKFVAGRLANPLYGRLITPERARAALLAN